MKKKTVGVLALQGDFDSHAKALQRAGARAVEVRTAAELDSVDGLVIPGGESTTMLKLLEQTGLAEPLRRFGESRPIFGTCAGAILLATEVSHPAQSSLGLVDIAIQRNAYGRQLDSRIVRLQAEEGAPISITPAGGDGNDGALEAVFIRAPIIRRVGTGGRVLARYAGDPVLVEHGRHLVATFHPELTADLRIHRLFLAKLEQGEPTPS